MIAEPGFLFIAIMAIGIMTIIIADLTIGRAHMRRHKGKWDKK